MHKFVFENYVFIYYLLFAHYNISNKCIQWLIFLFTLLFSNFFDGSILVSEKKTLWSAKIFIEIIYSISHDWCFCCYRSWNKHIEKKSWFIIFFFKQQWKMEKVSINTHVSFIQIQFPTYSTNKKKRLIEIYEKNDIPTFLPKKTHAKIYTK